MKHIIGDLTEEKLPTLVQLVDGCGGELGIYSDGGTIDVAICIASRILSRGDITTHVTTWCASAATLVFFAGRKRVVTPWSRLYFHHIASVSHNRSPWDDTYNHMRGVTSYRLIWERILASNQIQVVRNLFREERVLLGKEIAELGLAELKG